MIKSELANQDPYFQIRCQQILTDRVYLGYLCYLFPLSYLDLKQFLLLLLVTLNCMRSRVLCNKGEHYKINLVMPVYTITFCDHIKNEKQILCEYDRVNRSLHTLQ